MSKSGSTHLPSERRPADLATGIVGVLRQELAAGVYEPEAVFTELALSERFGVSRTPVREALLLLERDGLLVQRERSFALPRYSRQQMDNLFDVRRQLEPYALRRIVELRPAPEIDAYVAWAREALRNKADTAAYIQAHQNVRAELLRLCHNAFIRNAIETFDHQTAFVRQQTLRHSENLTLSVRLTNELLDALSKHDPDAVEAAAEASLQAAHQAIIHLLENGQASQPA